MECKGSIASLIYQTIRRNLLQILNYWFCCQVENNSKTSAPFRWLWTRKQMTAAIRGRLSLSDLRHGQCQRHSFPQPKLSFSHYFTCQLIAGILQYESILFIKYSNIFFIGSTSVTYWEPRSTLGTALFNWQPAGHMRPVRPRHWPLNKNIFSLCRL